MLSVRIPPFFIFFNFCIFFKIFIIFKTFMNSALTAEIPTHLPASRRYDGRRSTEQRRTAAVAYANGQSVTAAGGARAAELHFTVGAAAFIYEHRFSFLRSFRTRL